MRTFKSRWVSRGMVALTVGFLAAGVVPDAKGQTTVPPPDPAPYPSYSAKFVCGPAREDADVVRGMYASTINIQNPQLSAVAFDKQAIIALPERDAEAGTFGMMSTVKTESLMPGQAMGVDCKDIRLLFGTADLPAHIEGFLVVSVPLAKDDVLGVVAKYSARQIAMRCHHRHHDDDDDDNKGKHLGKHKRCQPDKHDDDDDDGHGRNGKNRFWLGWGPDVETLDVEDVRVKYVLPLPGPRI